MRHTGWLVLIAVVTAAALWSWLGLPAAAAQQGSDRYAVPDGGAAELVKFIQQLSAYQPSSPEEDIEYRRKFRGALGQAAEKVLKLDKDPKSEAHQAARFVLLVNRVYAFAEADPVGQKQTIADVKSYLKEQLDGGQGAVGVSLAKSLGEKLELMGEWAQAAEVLKDLAEVAGKSEEEIVSRAAAEMSQTAERLAASSSQIDRKVPKLAIPPKGNLVPLDLAGKTNLDITSMSGSGSFPANGLAEVSQGEHAFAGVRFRVLDKVIQLAGTNLKDAPAKVEGIAVDRKITRLYVLHAMQGPPGETRDGTRIGEYMVHYEDGSTATMPIAFGEDMRDWWNNDQGRPVTRGRVAWTGSNFSAAQSSLTLRLFLGVWENPHPAKKVSNLDFISTTDTPCAPFCVAITVEEPASD